MPSSFFLKLFLVIFSLCNATPRMTSQALTEEKSVNPGINDNFMAAELNVSEWVERFEREGREVYDQRMDIVSAIGLGPGQDIADIGAGTGLFTGLFSDAVGKDGNVYAVDIVPVFLSNILKRAKETGRTNIKTVLGTSKSTRLPSKSIDKVFICDTYHHFEFPANTLASISRALRSGGEIILIDFKREEGESSDWILKHVRAGEPVFTAEIEAAGFEKIASYKLLKDNYILRFRKRN
jgi:ubiquinone/menaquinone biosynthesis C-methylase UbiE